METFHLEDRPEFAPTIADHCWHAWWRDSGATLAQYQAAVERMTAKTRLPSALVACQGGTFAGSVLLIDDDLPDRPQLTPWKVQRRPDPDCSGKAPCGAPRIRDLLPERDGGKVALL